MWESILAAGTTLAAAGSPMSGAVVAGALAGSETWADVLEPQLFLLKGKSCTSRHLNIVLPGDHVCMRVHVFVLRKAFLLCVRQHRSTAACCWTCESCIMFATNAHRRGRTCLLQMAMMDEFPCWRAVVNSDVRMCL